MFLKLAVIGFSTVCSSSCALLMCRHVLILHVAQGERSIVQTSCLLFRGSQPSFCGSLPSSLSFLIHVLGSKTMSWQYWCSEGWLYSCRTLMPSGPFLNPSVHWAGDCSIELCAGVWGYKGSHGQVSCLGLALSNYFSHFCTERSLKKQQPPLPKPETRVRISYVASGRKKYIIL